MSMQLTPPVLPNPLAGYTAPKLPSVASAEAQAQNAVTSALTGSTTSAAAATSGTAAAGAAAAKPATTSQFHALLQHALTKTVQSMASNTARQTGVHPDQSGAPTNAQAATGHAVNLIA